MMNLVFDKTDKGREEIATRKYLLSAKLRGLLLLIDGKHTATTMVEKFSSVGFNEEVLKELLANEFIHPVVAEAVAAVAAMTPDSASIETAAAQHAQSAADELLVREQNQYQLIYRFYTETIKSTVGLRGYGLQLKVERARSIEDLHALRTPYLEAVFNVKGEEMARSLRDRLDQLLYSSETPPLQRNPSDPAL